MFDILLNVDYSLEPIYVGSQVVVMTTTISGTAIGAGRGDSILVQVGPNDIRLFIADELLVIGPIGRMVRSGQGDS